MAMVSGAVGDNRDGHHECQDGRRVAGDVGRDVETRTNATDAGNGHVLGRSLRKHTYRRTDATVHEKSDERAGPRSTSGCRGERILNLVCRLLALLNSIELSQT